MHAPYALCQMAVTSRIERDSAGVSSWEGQDEVRGRASQLRLQRMLGIFLFPTSPASRRPHVRFPSGTQHPMAHLRYVSPSSICAGILLGLGMLTGTHADGSSSRGQRRACAPGDICPEHCIRALRSRPGASAASVWHHFLSMALPLPQQESPLSAPAS